MPLDPNRIEEVFAAALQQGSAEARAAFLETACAGDVALRDRVEALLRAHGEASHFLVRAAVEQLVAQPGTTETVGARQVAPELTVTSAEQPGDDEANALDFLQPSTKPGALGRLGHYEVLEVLGKGGFGIVLKAFDELLHRVVAIKVMSTQLAATSPARKRFLREARASAKVRHDNVVAIYAVEEQPIPYLVMEYIAGETLQQRLDRVGPLDTPEVLRLGQQIAGGLAAAHAMGLIHRDIKPSNILLEKGVEQHVKITDFGLARAADDASLTQSGFIAGTPMYMAPEQAEGQVIDQRADLFSLGSVLYVMCSGRPPFRASTTMAVLKRVTEDTPRPIREIIPEVPEWLCALIAKLHAKNPAERFQSAKEVTDLLSQHLAHLQQPTLPPPASIFPAPAGPASRAGLDSFGSGSARRTYFGKRVLLNIVIASSIFGALACILWAILWLTRDKEPPISPPGVTTPVPPLAKAPFSAAEAQQYQDAWAKHLGVELEMTNSIGMKLRLIPPGEFLMGTPPEILQQLVEMANSKGALAHEITRLTNEGVQHPVRLTRPFFLGSCEVTRGQFRQFVEATHYKTELERNGRGGWSNYQGKWVRRPEHVWQTPGEWQPSDDEPVVHMTWNDAKAFCEWLSTSEGLSYTLPTEAQWEFACRAGTAGVYYPADYQSLQEYAWTEESLTEPDTHRPRLVGLKKPNAFGLFDMLGNAWEFCDDWYSAGPTTPALRIDPTGATQGVSRSIRGGAWYRSGKLFARCSARSAGDSSDAGVGFRVAIIGNLKPKTPSLTVAPFVVLVKGAKAERKFATLVEAVAAAQSGDTVEIQGNGPFVAAPIVLLEKRLTIRAGQGYHPVLTPATETPKWQPFFDTNAPLVLEGLEFRVNGQPFALPEKNAYRYAIRTRQPLYLANCRFVAKSGEFATIRSSGSSCHLLNCQFLGADLHGALDWESSDGGKVLLKNCQQAGNHFWFACHDDSAELNNVTVQLTENTVLAGTPLTLLLGVVPGQVEAPFRMEASRNILQGARQAFALYVTNEVAEKKIKGNKAEVLKKLVHWQGQENVYGNKGDFLQLGEGAPVRSLQDWKQFWGSAEEKSQRELPSFEGGDLLKLAASDPERMEANHFRLKAGSPGKGAGPGAKDIGADADFVGPGAAYEKWKQTPEYQEWHKKIAALMADGD